MRRVVQGMPRSGLRALDPRPHPHSQCLAAGPLQGPLCAQAVSLRSTSVQWATWTWRSCRFPRAGACLNTDAHLTITTTPTQPCTSRVCPAFGDLPLLSGTNITGKDGRGYLPRDVALIPGGEQQPPLQHPAAGSPRRPRELELGHGRQHLVR